MTMRTFSFKKAFFSCFFLGLGLSAACDQEDIESRKLGGLRYCGGFAGLTCPKGQVCVDDPSDDCDPEKGGADCIGLCVPDLPDGPPEM